MFHNVSKKDGVSIKAVISAAANGDTIIIEPGIYTEQIDLKALQKSVNLIGKDRFRKE